MGQYRGKADHVSHRHGELAEGSPTLIAERVEAVASLRLRGATLREIQEMLPKLGIVNKSKDGAPWSLTQIHEDVKSAREMWLSHARDDVREHYTRILSELQEIKKAAWARGDLDVVLRTIAQECKIFGFNAAIKVRLEGDKSTSERGLEKALAALSVEKLEVLREVYVSLSEAGVDTGMVLGQLVAAE